MQNATVESALEEGLEVFLRNWGPIDWRGLIDDIVAHEDQELATMLQGLAGIEDDAFYMQTKIRHSGILRSPSVRQFNAVWLVEEADHSRALTALAAIFGSDHLPHRIDHGTFGRDRRSIAAIPGLRLASLYPNGILGAYFLLGCFTEYVAVTIYNAVGDLVDDRAGQEIFRQMARQEGRHMRFYRTGAEVILQQGRRTQLFVRTVAERFWRPPGVDLYGRDLWVRIFRPIIGDEQVRTRLLRMDDVFSTLPGLEGLNVVARFIDGLGPVSVVTAPLEAVAQSGPVWSGL